MNLMRTFALTAAVTILFLVGSSGIAQTSKTEVTTFQLGNQLTVIPAPEGFEEAASQFESVKELFSRTEVADNDMLSVDLPKADCDKLRAGEAATFKLYTKVSIRKAIRDLDYSSERFAELVATFRKSGAQALDVNGPVVKNAVRQLDKGLSEINKKETTVALSQPVNLGEFDTRPNVYGVILLLTFTSKSGDSEVTTPLVAGLSYVRVKQRLIYVYTYRVYNSAADVAALRDLSKQWLTKILAAN